MQRSSRPAARPSRASRAAPPLRWDDARVLLALVQARTLSAAGARLGIDASTVSRRLSALEEALGARLFDRTPDGLLPTSLAEELAPHAEVMARAAAELTIAAEGREALPEGEVRVSAPPGAAEFLLAPALPRLNARYPRLRLALDASVAYVDLTRREADLALRARRPTSGDLIVRSLGESRGALYGSKAYVTELGRLRQLADARFIGWGDDLSHLPPGRFLAERVPPEAIVLRTSHMGTQLSAAAAGLGLVVLDAPMAKASGLVEVELAPNLRRSLPALPAGESWLVVHRALREVPRVAAVWDFIIELAREHTARW
jgi:DNA-binding transcriptional LysR family regulator